MPAFDRSMPNLYLERASQATKFNKTTAAYATVGWYINKTTQSLVDNETTSFLEVDETTLAFDINQTTKDWYLNETSTKYDVATVNTPITGYTYTLFCITCCLTLFGLVGNGLILVTMFKLKNRFKGHGKLLTSLAISDTFALVSWALEQPCTHEMIGFDIRAMDTTVCKISWAIVFISTYCSSGVVVLVCLERFLAVWFPLKTRYFLSERNILRAMCVCLTPIFVIFTVSSILYVETKDEICHPNFLGTQYSTVLKRLPNTAFYNASNALILILFMLILSIFIPLIIIKLYKQKSVRRQLTTNGPNAQLQAIEFKTSVKLVAVVIAQLSLVGLPGIGTSLIVGISGSQLDNDTRSALCLALLLNHSINFLLYNAFDSEFRKNVLALLGITRKDKAPEILMRNLNAEIAAIASTSKYM